MTPEIRHKSSQNRHDQCLHMYGMYSSGCICVCYHSSTCDALHELLGFHISFEELVKLKKKSGASCMPYFGTVNSLLSVDSHGLLGGLTDGLPSTLGSARSRFELARTSLGCPPYAALTSVWVFEMTRRRDCLMTSHFLIWSLGPQKGSVDRICHQTDSMNRFYLDVETGPDADEKNRQQLLRTGNSTTDTRVLL